MSSWAWWWVGLGILVASVAVMGWRSWVVHRRPGYQGGTPAAFVVQLRTYAGDNSYNIGTSIASGIGGLVMSVALHNLPSIVLAMVAGMNFLMAYLWFRRRRFWLIQAQAIEDQVVAAADVDYALHRILNP